MAVWTKVGAEELMTSRQILGASLVAQTVKNLAVIQETHVRSLGWEEPLEKGMAIHASILVWRIQGTEEPGRLQSMGSQRVGHNWAINSFFFRRILDISSTPKDNPENTTDRQGSCSHLPLLISTFSNQDYKKGGPSQRLKTKSHKEGALNMQPLQSHTTDVDDNTSDNCGKLYYREILPTPYIYSQILFHWFISKSMCLLHRQVLQLFSFSLPLCTGSILHLFPASACETSASHIPEIFFTRAS